MVAAIGPRWTKSRQKGRYKRQALPLSTCCMMYRRDSGTQSRSPQRHCTRLGKLRRNTGRHPHRRSESSPGRKAKQGVYQLRNWISSPEVTRSRRTVQTARSTLGVTQANLRDTRRLFERGIVARMEVDTPQNSTGERIRLGMSAKLAVVLYHNEHGRRCASMIAGKPMCCTAQRLTRKRRKSSSHRAEPSLKVLRYKV